MKTGLFYSLHVFCVLCLTGSCTLEKRVHSRGFHMEWLSSGKPKTNPHHTAVRKKDSSLPTADSLPAANEEHALAEAGTQFMPSDQSFIKHARATEKNQGCDVMFLRSGEEVNVKVLEVSAHEIKYKKCENLEGPDYYINKSDVFMIKYANGVKEVFDEKVDKEPGSGRREAPPHVRNNIPYGAQTVPAIATVAFILSIVSYFLSGFGFFTSIAGLVLGINAVNKIKRNPELYRGHGLAVAAIVLSALFLFILLLALIIIVALISNGGI